MKKYYFAILFIAFSNTMFSQTDYYWYKNNKVYLEKNLYKKFVLFENISDSTVLKQVINISDINVDLFNTTQKHAIVSTQTTKLTEVLLSDKSQIIYEAPYYFIQNKNVGFSNLFYVKLYKEGDSLQLKELANLYNVKIIRKNKFMKSWYILECTKHSAGNALYMANLFYETGYFSASEPELMTENPSLCVNDTYFGQQWGLENTGQFGGTPNIDINICTARGVTTGNQNIIVGVFDSGLQYPYHSDLVNNIYYLSYDTETGSSPQQFKGSAHQSLVAGVVGATANNNLGIAGVAPNCPMMMISRTLQYCPTEEFADGINFAWQNGASVINNSWYASSQSQLLDDAITDALTLGRNGLGCIVVFSTGNENSPNPIQSYPAYSNPDIIAVGAINYCGERKSINPVSCDNVLGWGSNYGTALDVMAPGVEIYTTSTNNQYIYGDGTSLAAPCVAGIAALMLSLNPCLTQKQVSDIIEQTSKKVGNYNYQITTGRPNGTWNNEMGYGLVDAYQAVQMVQSNIIINPIISTNTTWNDEKYVKGVLTINAGATLTINNLIHFDDQASSIIVNSNANLIVEQNGIISGSCIEFWNGLLHVKENAELLVKNGSKIKMGGNGQIFIDYANGQAGKLRYMNGANIILNDYTTKLEIKGNLQIMSFSNFQTQGLGYVRFNSPLADNLCYNIIAGTNTTMSFIGTSTSHKKLEISQPSLYAHDLSNFTVSVAKVELTGNLSRLSISGPVFMSNAVLTSSGSTRTNHRGLALYGQTNVSIENSVFSNGLYGIHAMLNYTAGAPLTLTNCHFTNNTRGLNVNDKGITLNYCTFTGNDYGVYADGMTFSSVTNYSSFTYNLYDGIRYTSASTDGLYVLYPTITNNAANGIWYSGATKLSVRCGEIRNNPKGIYFSSNASLNMSQSETPLGGRVNMSVNTQYNLLVNNGNLLFLNNGYNNLQRSTGGLVISGNLGGYSACPTYLPAQYNRWNASNSSPVYNTDYTLVHNGTCKLNQIYLTDKTPTYATCSAPPPPPLSGGDFSVAGSSVINSQNYSNINIANAVADAVNLTENGNHYLASDRLHEILNYPLLSTNAADNYYLNKAYLYMKQNMAHILQNLVSDTAITAQNTLANYAGKLRIIQNKIINQSQNNTVAYSTYFYTSLDKALLYRALYQYDNALLNLNNILSWATPVYSDEVNKWLCLTQLEKDVLDSIVRKEDFFELKQLCENNMSLKIAPNNSNENSQNDTFKNENEVLNTNLLVQERAYINVTPNPVINQSVIETFVPVFEKQAVIKVLDMLGRTASTLTVTSSHSRITISNSSLKEGIYYFVLIKDDVILDKVRVVFMKE